MLGGAWRGPSRVRRFAAELRSPLTGRRSGWGTARKRWGGVPSCLMEATLACSEWFQFSGRGFILRFRALTIARKVATTPATTSTTKKAMGANA